MIMETTPYGVCVCVCVFLCMCVYFVSLWHLHQVPVQSLYYLCIWQTNYLNSATLRKHSLVHIVTVSHVRVSFFLYLTLVFFRTVNGKSKCALKTRVRCSC